MKKSLAMLGGSFVVYVAVACASSAMNDRGTPFNDGGHQAKDAIAEIGIDVDDLVDAVRDALADGAPGDAKADPPPVSGTRLRARYTVTKSADGATRKVFAGWFDKLRKEPCTEGFYPQSDGKRHCLPVAAISPEGYQDAACTKGLVRVSTACPSSSGTYAYRITSTPTTCVGFTHQYDIFALTSTEVTMTSTSPWYAWDGTKCVARTSAWPYPTTTETKILIATDVAPSSFAELTTTEEIE